MEILKEWTFLVSLFSTRWPQGDILKYWARFALYQGDSCQIRTWPFVYDNQAYCQMSLKSVENYLRYGVLKLSFGRGLRSIWAILVNIELDLHFMITKHPAKFHRNRLRTFWVILITDRKTERLTRVKQYLFPNIVLGEVKSKRKIKKERSLSGFKPNKKTKTKPYFNWMRSLLRALTWVICFQLLTCDMRFKKKKKRKIQYLKVIKQWVTFSIMWEKLIFDE